jgi:O-6-methylguanine DNA methyltransferase
MASGREKREFPTTWGAIVVEHENGKVVACRLPYLDTAPKKPFQPGFTGTDPLSIFMASILSGQPVTAPAVDIANGTVFQQNIWRAIAKIKPGTTRTYAELARKADSPNAFRAAGSACGKNPVPLFIPCHRVVGSHGKDGGFSAGMAWKKMLLSRERQIIA